MRKIGSLPSGQQAKLFEDYLLTTGVEIKVEQSVDQWSIWVYDEDQIEHAKQELQEFSANPDAEKFQGATRKAEAIRESKIKKVADSARKQVNVRDTWNQPFTSRCPVTSLLIGVSVVVYLFMQTNEYGGQIRQALSISSFQTSGNMIRYSPYLLDIREGEVWRLVTPIFIHFRGTGGLPLHLLFNCFMTYQLGGAIEGNRGSTKLLLLVLLAAIPSNLAQFYWAGPSFGGLSGVVYGMFGYMWMKSKFDPQSSFYVPPNMVVILIGWFFLCMTGAMGSVANMAHAGGLGMGMLIGVGTTFLKQAGKSK
ncbi:rhomboid family intramembrane serine protease [Gimesia maris]|jgi:GlpG protein|uniref:Rhomboid protease GlpG n=3 Tax=Gimesia maris TaxID=122 RepID=A0ABX5YMI2_9PLAN|nr:rhomboid family intramembrane serine protease [Gimesia maris]MAC51825.1 intramembrane serine protease GlpG [Gimesia sp.]EDL56463.1 probable glpG protein [Gimesia maris DSM 8797]QDU14883.1 Rhomboid protease GlpG [Gimesia maris]QEG16898.1 Rhomboid protease GlpG [Gimesia maris]QGQ29968.1 rhomboid family intramembrane serine protease [Gimesia maris]|tara:strand:- start:4348 stop:5274 length:927 start_codon:yes stop_codon:yes gene_type:complete